MTIHRGKLGRALAVLLCLLTLAFAPGLAPYQAAARVIVTAPGRMPAAPPVLPRPAVISAAAGLTAAAPPAAVPAPARIEAPAASEPPAVRLQLSGAVEALALAPSDSGRAAALHGLFAGSGKAGLDESGLAPEAAPDPAEPGAAALAAPRLSDLEAVAADSSRPLAERKAAVARIAERTGLERVAAANPEGSSEDYEVHRAALRALAAGFGELRSLRPISERHKKDILARLEADKPELYVTDYDDTLEPFRGPLSPETAAALAAAADAGVETAVLTDRDDVRHNERDVSILDSLARAAPGAKARLAVLSNRGTRGLLFDRAGEAALVFEHKIELSAADKTAIQAVSEAAAAIYGRGEFNGSKEFWNAFSYSMLLPAGTPDGTVKAAAAYFSAELAKRGVDIEVVARTAADPKNPPYVTASRVDKSLGMASLRRNRRAFESMRDLLRLGLPGRWARKAFAWADRLLPARPIPAGKVVAVGDQFFDTKVSDMGLAKGAPGGAVISVGGQADPRLDDVVVWPSRGRAASLEILAAVGKRAPSGMDKKAVAGLFLQRTASIAAFIITSIAFPFLAVPIVGWGSYGVLMSLGTAAGIATGPLNGLIADRLSARNAMALNTILRVLLSLLLPAAAAFGVLNFGTLLAASFANGWLLSSIMTTESAYVKRLAGAENVLTVNNLIWINYLAVQVLLSLLLGIGSVVDKWDPIFAFTLNAIVNAAVVFPIIWFTMPSLSPAPKALLFMEARIAKLEAGLAGSKGEAKAALLEEIAAARRALAARERELKASVEGNRRAVAENSARLAELETQSPAGPRARWERWSELSFLRADSAIRARATAQAEMELGRRTATFKDRLAEAGAFLKKNWASGLVFAAGVGACLLWNTTMPIIGALTFWITTTDGFKVLWHGRGSEVSPREKELAEQIEAARRAGRPVDRVVQAEYGTWKNRMLRAMLLLALVAIMMFPLQYLAIPKIATLLVGEPAKALVTGQLLGALFFGNLISTSAKARLPEKRLPLVGKVPAERLVQFGVAVLGAVWAATGLFPGSMLAGAAAAMVIFGLISLSRRLSNRAWVKFVGVGFSAVWLPYLVWGTSLLPFVPVQLALMLSLLAIGMAFGPAYSYLMGYFYGNAAKDKSGAMGGVQGSLYNAAISAGYGLLSLAAALMNPAYPALLAGLGLFYLLAGFVFWRAPKALPGIPPTLLEPKKD
ncbi:MAG: hypothetical protein PHF00_09955 [Elusimicrobia bacterium]|nr:hypothetical protein [Elusimicrobiota bacterium]